jgi:D-alanyl-lipoteichoic acid acyltransferase DltB (MBOAT superfamily)
MVFNYGIGLQFNGARAINNKQKKILLFFGIFANLALLGYFKYYDFFIENINIIFNENASLLHLMLPLAISFFTFQQVAYLVDSYRQEVKEHRFLNYALFVTFFPQLIAGPIVHHREMMPQFSKIKNKVINYKNVAAGLFIFSIGLFKKVIIADSFSEWATNGFDVSTSLSLFSAWATSLSYTFQLYFDFSGYADMAIGLALLFNIKLPINFNSPYKAVNIQDFWRRWHITLSRFLRDYVYIPLGGSREGEFRTYYNLMATFIIGGLWHGAGWTFLFWGFLHGSALIVQKLWNHLGIKLWTWFAWFITFNFINISWIFFRAKEWDDAIKVLGSMFGFGGVVLSHKMEKNWSYLAEYGVEFGNWMVEIGGGNKMRNYILVVFFIILFCKNSMQKLDNFQLNYKYLFSTITLFVFSILSLQEATEFLYFNF